MPDRLLCDFCSSPAVTWEYPAADFETFEGLGKSIGSWAACDQCAEYIERDELPELAVLTVESFIRSTGTGTAIEAELIAMLAQNYAKFAAARLGPRKPETDYLLNTARLL